MVVFKVWGLFAMFDELSEVPAFSGLLRQLKKCRRRAAHTYLHQTINL